MIRHHAKLGARIQNLPVVIGLADYGFPPHRQTPEWPKKSPEPLQLPSMNEYGTYSTSCG